MYDNVGKKPVTINGKQYMFSPLSPAGMSTFWSYVDNKYKPDSTYVRVCKQNAEALANCGLPPGPLLDKYCELLRNGQEKAALLDHEEHLRERFTTPQPPLYAILKADVASQLFFLLAKPNHPELTQEECDKVLSVVGGPGFLIEVGKSMPDDVRKKDSGPLDYFFSGLSLTGPEN